MRAQAPIRADELVRGDRVLLFGTVIEVLDLAGHEDFPGTVRLAIRRWGVEQPPGRPASTLLPNGHLLMGLWLPRRFDVLCALCLTPVPVRANIAEGVPSRVMCTWCANPLVEGTVVLPSVQAP